MTKCFVCFQYEVKTTKIIISQGVKTSYYKCLRCRNEWKEDKEVMNGEISGKDYKR